jgi:CHC2 zinc finger
MIADNVIAQLKADNPCDQVASQWVRLRRRGKGFIGPCPICSKAQQSKTDGRFEIKDRDGWVCASCQDGGDVIALVMRVEGCDFKAAVERLGGAREVDQAEVEKRARERAADQEKRERDAHHFRERERGKLYDIWNRALAPAGTAVEHYLALRRLALPPDANKRLRLVPEMPYFAHGGRDALWRGPVMVAPIVGTDGIFRGLHFTYIDLAERKGKARIEDPETGEFMPAKKVRGSKAGGFIPLIGKREAFRLVIGEGIETVLSVWHALAPSGRDLGDWAFWSAVDLGNLGGKAAATVAHPALVDARGRARRVPGPEPDLDAPAIALPDSVEDVVLLGDGDSDRLLTEYALRRATSRWTTSRRTIRTAFAPSGHDFNDLLGAAP